MKSTPLEVEVVGGLIVAGILGMCAWLWQRRRAPLKLPGWIRRRRAQRATRTQDTQLSRLHQAIVERAAQLDVVIPLTSTSTSDQTTVRWSNGNQTRHYRDWATYGRDMQALRTPLESSFTSPPATPVDRWPADQCKTWLTEHPRPPGRFSVWWSGVRGKLGRRRNSSAAGE